MSSQIIKSSFVFILFISINTLLNAQQELKDIDTKLDSIFGQYDNGEKPGVAIAIIEKNKPINLRSYGYANLEYRIKNTPNSLFNATDLAKQFTVFSILILQDQGKLNIDDNIKKYVPELNDWPFEITLKNLMEQTSGLRDVMELKKWNGYQNGDIITKQDVKNTIAKQRTLNFTPGSKFEYNRTGYVLLTEVIEAVSNMSFQEFVDKHIFTPLGMENSVFVDDHTKLILNRSYSYTAKDNGFRKVVNNSSFVGGTNLYTSISDFTKWLKNMSSQSIGKPSFYTYLQTKVELSDEKRTSYTPGIFKENSEGYWRIHLEGFDHGYTGYMMHIPEYDFSLVYFSNDIDFPIDNINPILWNWFNRDYSIGPVKSPDAQKVTYINKSKKELQKYTGSYFFEDYFNVRKVVFENDTLFYVRSETSRMPLVPISGNHTFKMLLSGNDNIRVTFKNQNTYLEFRTIFPGEDNDYTTLGRKLNFQEEESFSFNTKYINEELGQAISFKNTNEGIHLLIEGASILLDQIGENEFLTQANPKVKYVKLQRDDQLNIVGVYLSGTLINNIYYKMYGE